MRKNTHPLIAELTAKSAEYRQARTKLYADMKRTVDAQLSTMNDEVENLIVRAKANGQNVAAIARAITPPESTSPNRPKVYEVLKRHAEALEMILSAAPEATGPYSWTWHAAPGKDKATGLQNYDWLLHVDYTKFEEPHDRQGWNVYRFEWNDRLNEYRFYGRRSERVPNPDTSAENKFVPVENYANDLALDMFTTDRAKAKARFYNKDATAWMKANPKPTTPPEGWTHPDVDTKATTADGLDGQPALWEDSITEAKPPREERAKRFDNPVSTDTDDDYDASKYEDWELDA